MEIFLHVFCQDQNLARAKALPSRNVPSFPPKKVLVLHNLPLFISRLRNQQNSEHFLDFPS